MMMTSEPRWFDQEVSPKRAIEIAEGLFGLVPTGWQSLWHDTLVKLVSARHPAREFALTYLSVETDDGVLMPDMPETDAVLDGIVRRCVARSRHICRQCGRTGRWRQFGMYDGAVLCARCAAAQLLHRAISDAVSYPGLIAIGGKVDGPDLVPEVLRREFARAAQNSSAPHEMPRMDKSEFLQWVGRLQRIKEKLPPCVEFSA